MSGVTYYVGMKEAAVSIGDIGDAHEVIDHVHTLVMDAAKITPFQREVILSGLEKVMEKLDDMMAAAEYHPE